MRVSRGSTACTTLVLEQEPECNRSVAAADPTTWILPSGNIDLVEKLLEEAGDIPEAKDKYSVITRAALDQHNMTLVRLMTTKGINIFLKDTSGKCLLDHAMRNYNSKLIQEMLENAGGVPEAKYW